MAFTAFTRAQEAGPNTYGVVVCSDHDPDDCIPVGSVRQDVVTNVWTIDPANAQRTGERYADEAAATLALLEHEYEYLTQIPTEAVEEPLPLVGKTIEFLRELLTENDD